MSAERIRETDTSFHRYLFNKVDWNSRVGKLQTRARCDVNGVYGIIQTLA